MSNINLLPCIYLHIKYVSDTNTYSYIEVNNCYSDLFNIDNSLFTNKEVGFLDSLDLSMYSDISLLIYLNTLNTKENYQTNINLIVKQNNITKTINDTLSLMLLGKTINNQEFIVIGHKDINLTANILEPTSDRIIDNIPVYVYWKDFNGKYLGSNNSLAPYLVVDEPVYSSLDVNNTSLSYFKYCDNLINTSKKSLLNIIETHLLSPDGRKIHVRANKIPIIIKDFIIAILYTYEDVTIFIEQINLLNDTKQLLKVKEQQYQELVDKVNNNVNSNINTNSNNTIVGINEVFSSLNEKNSDNQKELLQLELLLNRIEEQVKTLYQKVYTADNSLISELAVLKENQDQDNKNFNITECHIQELTTKVDIINNSISVLLFFKHLTTKQLLLFFLIFSLIFTYLGNKLNSSNIKKIIDYVEKVI